MNLGKRDHISGKLEDSTTQYLLSPGAATAETYKFKFSTQEDLAGKPSRCRLVTIILLVLATLFLPVAILLDKAISRVDWYFPWNSWLVYVLIVNTTFLMLFGAYIVSSVAYPYSNSIMVRNLTVNTNRKVGLEFSRCATRMTRMIKDMMERQNSDRASSIMEGKDDELTYEDESIAASGTFAYLSDKDIYMRVAQNLELIELYYQVNRKIIEEDPN